LATGFDVHDDPFDFDRPSEPFVELVPTPGTGSNPLPAAYRERVALHTIHDGGAIPRQYRFRADGTPLVDPTLLRERYLQGRDWGANVVAAELAHALDLPNYARIRIARVLLDFNRFPGSTPANSTEPLDNLAIGHLYAEALSHSEKTALLSDYYDKMSDSLEEALSNKLVSIALHTYDERNPSETKRADLSIISLPLAYQREARLQFGVFDPLYPDRLAESTCSRVLRDRISLSLEQSGFRVIHNHPYPIPNGSIELRSQVWFFFRYLRERLEADNPSTIADPPYQHAWTMLLDTNLRLHEAEILRSFLHRFRKAPPDEVAKLNAALAAYQHIREFLHQSTVVQDYRRSPDRPSSLGIEVRKDLVCTFDEETGRPRKPTSEQQDVARLIAQAIARAIHTYVTEDREVA